MSPEIRELIATMASHNPLWSTERIRGELLKLAGKTTIVRIGSERTSSHWDAAPPPDQAGLARISRQVVVP